MTSQRPETENPLSEPDLPRPKHLPLIGTARDALPAAIPARMLNEVMYCERLMYLEWVHGEFDDNYYTVEGRSIHSRADAPGGALPEPNADSSAASADSLVDSTDPIDPKPYQARAVWLTSEELGITAKIDIVEGLHDGSVVPVEYKRGRVPNIPERAYLPERVQLCAQVLLLREHGYRCDQAEIYFAGSKQRVEIEIADDLIHHTRWAIRVAREVAARPEPPEPLRNSPKCRGCSLVGICLPDEVNLLRRLDGNAVLDPPEVDEASTGPLDPDPWGLASGCETNPAPKVRRLYAARDDRVPLYVQGHGAQVGLNGERLTIRGEQSNAHVRLMNTSQVTLRGNVQISTQAARALLDRGIPAIFLSTGGWYTGRLIGTDTNNIDLRMAQYRVALDTTRCLDLSRDFVVAKIRNCRTLLRRNHPELDPVALGQLKQLARKARQADNLDSLLGLEGAAARAYFQKFAGMIKGPGLGQFDFERRNRRPPRDPINALLSFAYALLTKELVIATTSVGLEPLLGFYHQPRFGRPALALDLMEEFRPLIGDSVVINSLNTGVITRDDFVTLATACTIKDHARKRFIEAFERRMDQTVTHPVFDYAVSYRRILELQARLLSRVLLGELAHYPAFVTR